MKDRFLKGIEHEKASAFGIRLLFGLFNMGRSWPLFGFLFLGTLLHYNLEMFTVVNFHSYLGLKLGLK